MEEFYKNLFKVMSASEVGNAHSECRRRKIFRVKIKGYFGIFQQKLSEILLQYQTVPENSRTNDIFETPQPQYKNFTVGKDI